MFYTYNQNNSGGSFDFDPDHGISHYVIVEANNSSEADYRAEMAGVYFDDSIDCSCCGARWGTAWGEGDEVPSVYGDDVSTGVIPKGRFSMKWVKGPEGYIHYRDGRIVAVDYEG